MSPSASYISLRKEGVILTVKAKPGTSRRVPLRVVPVADGQSAVEVAVAAPPEDGKANKAILERLAKELGLKKNQLSIKAGSSGRLKTVEIEGDPEKLSTLILSCLSS